jgi:hypothetical protein
LGKVQKNITMDVKDQYLSYLNGEEGTVKYNKFKKILYGEPDSLVTRLFEYLKPRINEKKISLLDIGGGDGKRVSQLKELLEEEGIEVEITLIEPSEDFVKNVDQNAVHKVINSKFEDYVPEEKFDLILLIHSIYTFRDFTYLTKIKESLKDDGLVCIVANDKNSFLAQLKECVDENGKRKEVGSVIEELKTSGFNIEVIESDTRFSGCINLDGSLTEDGNLGLEWIAMRPIEEIDEEKLRCAEGCFVSNSKDGIISEKENFIFAYLKH